MKKGLFLLILICLLTGCTNHYSSQMRLAESLKPKGITIRRPYKDLSLNKNSQLSSYRISNHMDVLLMDDCKDRNHLIPLQDEKIKVTLKNRPSAFKSSYKDNDSENGRTKINLKISPGQIVFIWRVFWSAF